jgi:hypothetical protein
MVTEMDTNTCVRHPLKITLFCQYASNNPICECWLVATDLEEELYEENKNLHGVLGKLTRLLVIHHPNLSHSSPNHISALFNLSVTCSQKVIPTLVNLGLTLLSSIITLRWDPMACISGTEGYQFDLL